MSRSTKRKSFTGHTTAKSDKSDKQRANRLLRKQCKKLLTNNDSENLIMPGIQDVSSMASFAKDGKFYFDSNAYPELMRK